MHKILIIEDDFQARQLYEELLKDEGFDVVSAESGESGIEIYQEGGIDLVITDIFLPGVDGIQVTKTIHELNPHAQIIVISGGPNPNNGDSRIDLPDDLPFLRIFRKPFSIDMLVSEMRTLLAGV